MTPRPPSRSTRLRTEPSQRRFLAARYRDDEHLQMLAQVADYVDQAAQQQGGYFGRDATAVTAAHEVRRHVAENLPVVRD